MMLHHLKYQTIICLENRLEDFSALCLLGEHGSLEPIYLP